MYVDKIEHLYLICFAEMYVDKIEHLYLICFAEMYVDKIEHIFFNFLCRNVGRQDWASLFT